jgi:hypothetical protein
MPICLYMVKTNTVIDIVHVYIHLVQVRLKRKIGREGLGTFAAFRMLYLQKLARKLVVVLNSQATPP